MADRRANIPFLQAEWRNLVMVNYALPPRVLEPFVPAGTELDTWEGQAFVSLVAFQFLHTRIFQVPLPLHQSFEEVNLRFYVRRSGAEGGDRGVVFLQEVVSRSAIATAARLTYNEPYRVLPMRHRVQHEGGLQAQYEWRLLENWECVSGSASGEPAVPAEGSFESFITDKPWGFTRQRNGRTTEYRVRHPPWRLWPNPAVELDANLGALCTSELGPWLREPQSTLLVEGSPVTVYVAFPIR